MGDAKFVTKERRGLPPILSKTRNLGRYAPKFLAPAEGWWPSATNWQGLFIFFGGGLIFFIQIQDILINIGACSALLLCREFASPKGIEIKTK